MYTPAMFYNSVFSEGQTSGMQYEMQKSYSNDMKLKPEPDEGIVPFPKPYVRLVREELVKPKKTQQHKCNICGKILSSPSSYYVHLKQHSENKPYLCTMCDASFSRKPYLEVHMRTHTGEKPFECDTCHKCFTQKSSLNTHKRNHTGLKPFACQICLKRFSIRSYLVSHEYSHAAQNGITCNVCHARFNSRTQYTFHLESHKTREFECKYCCRFFTKESYLIRHKIRVHNDIHSDSSSD